ncbi:hypothetical protein U9M48_013289 [Paspalum notatum var. saurae]|uniref:Uncharacterized protein n=1 Tax=Paspalum notatum var. saurae TaxID=547442 RepID=A0AAQ3SZP6_PASNO
MQHGSIKEEVYTRQGPLFDSSDKWRASDPEPISFGIMARSNKRGAITPTLLAGEVRSNETLRDCTKEC